MKLIAHRGLLEGPDKSLENDPTQIHLSLLKGFDCEIDFWFIDQEFFLGHDGPTYSIKSDFLHQPGLWIHAKNLEALYWLSNTNLNYFWHQEDNFTLTSKGYIWTYPGKELTDKSISVMPEWNDPNLQNLNLNCFGICSDYINKISSLI